MGVIFTDPDEWEKWQKSRRRLRQAKSRVVSLVRPEQPEPFVLTSPTDEPTVIAAVDVPSGTGLSALVSPLAHVDAPAVLTRAPLPKHAVPQGWTAHTIGSLEELPDSITTMLSAGSYRAVSLPLLKIAQERNWRILVIQHGILTPYAIPILPGSEIVTWSEQDAEFWSAGRADAPFHVAGSQLLWTAAQRPAVDIESDVPLWLGQLHGAELPRRSMARAAESFMKETGATYRPHPGEKGIFERLQHSLWERKGFEFDRSNRSLFEHGRPVAAIFSTGILEAAVRGLPGWGYHPDPPSWVSELWERHGIAQYGHGETTVTIDDVEPARLIADLIKN